MPEKSLMDFRYVQLHLSKQPFLIDYYILRVTPQFLGLLFLDLKLHNFGQYGRTVFVVVQHIFHTGRQFLLLSHNQQLPVFQVLLNRKTVL